MDIKFGTDGWRAIVGEEFTLENVEKVIQAYADVLTSPRLRHPSPRRSSPIAGESGEGSGVRIFLGYDRRRLSREAAERAAGVLAANGFTVHFSKDYCPTPCISWMTKSHGANGGVIITASHNPASWNGVKFKESYGGSASPRFTAQIEEHCLRDPKIRRVPFESAVREGKIKIFNPRQDYVLQLRAQIDFEKIVRADWKVAFDPLFGAGAGFLEAVLERPVHEIHGEEDPSFGGLNPEPIDRNLSELLALVRSGGFDVGLATDGDADRIGAVDEAGRFVTPHQIYALILKHLIERGGSGDVVKTVSTTSMIDRIAARYGLKVHETPIGFKHICNKFLETKPLIGGEESGGIGVPSHVYERDGLLCGLLLLEVMSVKKKRLGELLKDLEDEIGPFHSVREDMHLLDENRAKVLERMARNGLVTLGGLKVRDVNCLDGTKYILEDGSWLLLRLSGTEPLLRVYAEAPSPELAQRLVAEGRRLLKL